MIPTSVLRSLRHHPAALGLAALLTCGSGCNQPPSAHGQTGGSGTADGSGGASSAGGGGGASSVGGGGDTAGTGGQAGTGGVYPGGPIPAPYADYFDPPVNGTYTDDYGVIGSITPPAWSWGKIELLEGHQAFRTEGYNLRTAKLRYEDTYQDSTYPLQTYYGALNQELVDGFNVHYQSACAGTAGGSGAPACPIDKGPTRPEARFVLLHLGPKTATLACDTQKTPVLLVHGAIQTGNVWLFPNGNDGTGKVYPGGTQVTGFVQALEAAGTCTYALTFGNFHGDNFNQAIHLANAVRRIEALTGRPKVDVITWSKGALAADLYLAGTASWGDWGTTFFEGLAAEQAARVPAFRADVRAYVPLSGPHRGIDLNFRHPFDDLVIFSTKENAPVGQGPVVWGMLSAIQCVTWGLASSPGSIFSDTDAYSVCANRGATWPDFWSRIYTSNITGLDAAGKPVSSATLGALNTAQGATGYSFDQYNMSMWGSIDDSGKYVSAYLGQLQCAYDLRPSYPTPDRQSPPPGVDWSTIDTDESKWRDWMVLKLGYNVAPVVGGAVLDDAAHTTCRNTAFDPAGEPCTASHVYYDAANALSYAGGYATYPLMDGIGIQAVMEMGGNFIERLGHHGLDPRLAFLYVLHGTSVGSSGTPYEYDGMSCPTCDPHGDGVLFDVSVAAVDQLTQGWSAADKAAKSKQDGAPYGHLDMGVTPAVWSMVTSQLAALP